MRNLAWWICITWAVCMACSTSAHAQYPDILDIQIQYLPHSKVQDPKPLHVQSSSYEIAVNIPIPITKRTFLVPGVTYHADSTSFHDAPRDFVDFKLFNGLDVSLLFVQLLGPQKKWSLSIRAAPGLAGDFKGFDVGILRMSGVAMLTYSFSEKLVLGGGLIASYNFGQFLPLPAIYFDWKISSLFQMDGFIPAFVNVNYTPHERIKLGVRVEFAGNSYGIRDPRIRNTSNCQTKDNMATSQKEQGLCLDNIAYSTGTVGAQVSVRLFSSLWLTSYTGYTFFRRFEPFTVDRKPLPSSETLPNQFIFRMSITWKIPTS